MARLGHGGWHNPGMGRHEFHQGNFRQYGPPRVPIPPRWQGHCPPPQIRQSMPQFRGPSPPMLAMNQQPFFETNSPAQPPPYDRRWSGPNRRPGFSNRTPNKFKNKIRGDTPVAESNMEKVWCKVCDKSFPNSNELDKHVAGHKVCGREGCKYSADPSLIALHIKLQHSTGLYKRIHDTQSIDQWIEQRKRNFPTKENIEKKKAQIKEMDERGERLTAQDSVGRKRMANDTRRNSMVPAHKRRRKNNKNWKLNNNQRGSILSRLNENQISEEPKSEVNEDKDKFSDDEWCGGESNKLDNSTSPCPQGIGVSNASLLSLISSYDSEPESGTGDVPTEIVDKKCSSVVEDKHDSENSDAAPEERAIEKGVDDSKETIMSSNKNRFNNKQGLSNRKRHRRAPPVHLSLPARRLTLLQKLLKKDMLKERNQLLQCVRFVVNNNFFDKQHAPDKVVNEATIVSKTKEVLCTATHPTITAVQ